MSRLKARLFGLYVFNFLLKTMSLKNSYELTIGKIVIFSRDQIISEKIYSIHRIALIYW